MTGNGIQSGTRQGTCRRRALFNQRLGQRFNFLKILGMPIDVLPEKRRRLVNRERIGILTHRLEEQGAESRRRRDRFDFIDQLKQQSLHYFI